MAVLRRGHDGIGISAGLAVEEADAVHGGQDAPHALVDLLLLDLSRRQGLLQHILAEMRPKGHLLVQSGIQRVRGGVRGQPVRHHPAPKRHAVLQVPQGLGVLACVHVVDTVVRAHNGQHSCAQGCREGGIIELPTRALANIGRYQVSLVLDLVVDPVLSVGNHALVLNALNDRAHQDGTQIRVLAGEILKVAPSCRHPSQPDTRRKLHIGSFLLELLRHGGCPPVHHVDIPGGGSGKRRWPGCRGPVRPSPIGSTEALGPVLHI
mmetsp:Transcript_19051/g.42488  ORF Transcript_19051/g.42488 Transcript_19051/m.42488 type:complete len:265 (+) Transcript_19051:2087-2881(+)